MFQQQIQSAGHDAGAEAGGIQSNLEAKFCRMGSRNAGGRAAGAL